MGRSLASQNRTPGLSPSTAYQTSPGANQSQVSALSRISPSPLRRPTVAQAQDNLSPGTQGISTNQHASSEVASSKHAHSSGRVQFLNSSYSLLGRRRESLGQQFMHTRTTPNTIAPKPEFHADTNKEPLAATQASTLAKELHNSSNQSILPDLHSKNISAAVVIHNTHESSAFSDFSRSRSLGGRANSRDYIVEDLQQKSEEGINKQSVHHMAKLIATLQDYSRELAAKTKCVSIPRVGVFPHYSTVLEILRKFLEECERLAKLNRTPSMFGFLEKFCHHHSKLVQQFSGVIGHVDETNKTLEGYLLKMGRENFSNLKGDTIAMIHELVGTLNLDYLELQKSYQSMQEVYEEMMNTALENQGATIKVKIGMLQAQTKVVKTEKLKVESQIEELKVQHKAVLDRAQTDITRLLEEKQELENKLKTALEDKKSFDLYLAQNGGSIEKLNRIITETRSQKNLLEQELSIIKSSVRDVQKTLNRKDRESVEAIRRVRELEDDMIKIKEAYKTNEDFRSGSNVLTSVMHKFYIDQHTQSLQVVDGAEEHQQLSLLSKDSDVVYKGNQLMYFPTFEQMLGQK